MNSGILTSLGLLKFEYLKPHGDWDSKATQQAAAFLTPPAPTCTEKVKDPVP